MDSAFRENTYMIAIQGLKTMRPELFAQKTKANNGGLQHGVAKSGAIETMMTNSTPIVVISFINIKLNQLALPFPGRSSPSLPTRLLIVMCSRHASWQAHQNGSPGCKMAMVCHPPPRCNFSKKSTS